MTTIPVPDPAFVARASEWMQPLEGIFLELVWVAYDEMRTHPPLIDTGDLERSITQLLEPRIRSAMSGFEPFYVQHNPFEHETMAPPPAQPPAYDLAFVLRADARVMWPMEAKIMETPRKLSNYTKEIREQFLSCRYAPFSASGAMLGYLLSGVPTDAFEGIARKLGCPLETIAEQSNRPARVSFHRRAVPPGKSYPSDFRCYHLILEYPGLQRHR